MVEFFKTQMGKRFFEGSVPQIAKSLDRIANALEKQNELKEKELELFKDGIPVRKSYSGMLAPG